MDQPSQGNCVSPTSLEKIKFQKTWCPYCRLFRGELICRSIFEIAFSKTFAKCRPEWLLNKTGRRLELDGFNSELNLAFEYQGETHQFEVKKHFHKNRSFKKQIENDLIKRRLCEENGILLLAINSTREYQKLAIQIKDKLNAVGVIPKICPTKIPVDQIKIQKDPSYTKLLSMAEKRNLTVISKVYTGVFDKHKFKCNKCNLNFFLIPDKLRSGAWCPKCSKEEAHQKMRCSFEQIASLATSRNGSLLTNIYKNDRTKMQWKCEKGHVWLASAGNIKRGHWCPVCVGQPWHLDKASFTKKMIRFYKDLASKKGGKCLSNEYKNAHVKLKWRCKKGHEWETSPRSVQLGSWCRVCRY